MWGLQTDPASLTHAEVTAPACGVVGTAPAAGTFLILPLPFRPPVERPLEAQLCVCDSGRRSCNFNPEPVPSVPPKVR